MQTNIPSLSHSLPHGPSPTAGSVGGINPTGTGIVGTQALIAFKQANGEITVKTYDLVSYRSIVQTKLSFEVSDLSAEYNDGVMRIFAPWELPENMTVVNQVWQVGASVVNDRPARHAFAPENLNAKGKFNLAEKNEHIF